MIQRKAEKWGVNDDSPIDKTAEEKARGYLDKISISNSTSNDGNMMLSAVPFTYEWWMEVGKKAYWKAENLAWHSYYWEVADYCRSRAEDCEFKRHSR